MYCSRVGRNLIQHCSSLLKKMSERQGLKFENPKSISEIPGFVRFYNFNLDDVSPPLDYLRGETLEQYSTRWPHFNAFFARPLQPSARPIAFPADNSVAIIPADGRCMVFPDVTNAHAWIKGSEFSIDKLLANHFQSDKYLNGSMVIARLAPQDYHRWHLPVSGIVSEPILVDGALYTVNPMAINNDINVYTENKRVLVEIKSPEFGNVLMIAVGATMVGSIEILSSGEMKKGQQHGLFKFGGSTVIILFEKNRIVFDQDLQENSKLPIETWVKVNTSLGRSVQ